MFERFPSLTRFSHGWTVTEKIDGTNAQIIIVSDANPDALPIAGYMDDRVAYVDGFHVFVGSRNNLIIPSRDNAGFARFVQENAADLVTSLGEGRHFGEWWGNGIQRNYGLKEKRFSLFNVGRWKGPFENGMLPDRVGVVPTILYNQYIGDASSTFDNIMADLKRDGSYAAPGFMNPEGIVMFHYPSKTTFKKTFDYDEQGKWAENAAARSIS